MINEFTLWSFRPDKPEEPWVYLACMNAESQEAAVEYFNVNGLLPRGYGQHAIITIR